MATSDSSPTAPPSAFTRPLLSGALAGITVDIALYPLDTLKTRLQSSSGFARSGGFQGVYKGLGSVVVGSAPGGALFFVFYEGVKRQLEGRRERGGIISNALGEAGGHMLAASVGEIAACAVRVPTEVIKQRAQAVQAESSIAALRQILQSRSSSGGYAKVWRELYRGWGITVFREVPFTMIQFPLWEALKGWGVRRRARVAREPRDGGMNRMEAEARQAITPAPTATESALFGSISGAVAAAATTPLDVLKTRMMLSTTSQPMRTMATDILRNEGAGVFFRGIVPRVGWISVGGAVFLGSYQWCWNMLGSVSGSG